MWVLAVKYLISRLKSIEIRYRVRNGWEGSIENRIDSYGWMGQCAWEGSIKCGVRGKRGEGETAKTKDRLIVHMETIQ